MLDRFFIVCKYNGVHIKHNDMALMEVIKSKSKFSEINQRIVRIRKIESFEIVVLGTMLSCI